MALFDGDDKRQRWMDGDDNRFMDDESRLSGGRGFRDLIMGASRLEEALPEWNLPIPVDRRRAAAIEAEPPMEGFEDEATLEKELKVINSAKRKKIRSDPPAYVRNIRAQKQSYYLSPQRIQWLKDNFSKYARPKTSPQQFIQENSQDALFYLQDIDYCTEDHSKYGHPLIRIAALTEKGNSACFVVRNVQPYFYVKPNRTLTARIQAHGLEKALAEFHHWLEERVRLKVDDNQQKMPDRLVTELVMLKKFTLYGYQKDPCDVIRVHVANPKLVVPTRDVLWALRRKKDAFEFEAGEGEDAADDHEAMETDDEGHANEVEWEDERAKQAAEQVEFDQSHEADLLRKDPYEIFEADVLFTLRFMIDTDTRGCSWFSVPSSKLKPPNQPRDRQSRCQLEFWIDVKDLTSLPQKQDVPPEIRLLCYDYEMASFSGRFPDPENDPIISASFMLFRLEDGNTPLFAASFYVGDSTPTQYKELPPGTPIIEGQFGKGHPYANERWDFASEAEMLLSIHWLETQLCDADYLEGYNSKNFDKCYEFHRADRLGIGCVVRKTSKLIHELCSVQSKMFSSKAHGTREDASIRMWGIVDWDILPIVQRDKKLRDYNLGAVGSEFLGETKFGLPHTLISPYWIGKKATPETRRIVRDYNQQDVWLTHRVQSKLCYLYRNQGMARVTTLPIELIITRGQAIKTTILLLRRCKEANIVVPTFATRSEKLTRAGYGIEPGKYSPDMLGKRYRTDVDWDDDESSDDEAEEVPSAKPSASGTTQQTLAPTNGGGAGDAVQQVQYRDGVDQMLLAQISQDEENDISVSRRLGMWTSIPKHNELIQKAWKERPPDGRVLLLVVAHRADMHTPKPLYGVCELKSDFDLTLRTDQWTNKLKIGISCCRVEWILSFDRENPPGLPEYLRRHRDCDKLNNREIEELFVKGNIKLKRKGKKRLKESDKYQGAVVIHPICGLYLVPIWTLDFSSLYPSAIICHNMCYTTLISKADALAHWKPEDYHVTPFGSYFLRKHIREGLVPKMLVTVIDARNVAKGKAKEAKNAGNMIMLEVFESEQNALKIVANGSYGFMGAKTAPIPCLAIAASTTAYGRDAIMLVWEKIETEFALPPDLCPNGERPIIIDSVFGIWPNCLDPKRASELAIKAAKWVSDKYFQPPMKTVFEKLMFPLIMEGRKRYGYVYWSIESIAKGEPDMVQVPSTKPEEKKKWARIEAKGIETVRRDNCVAGETLVSLANGTTIRIDQMSNAGSKVFGWDGSAIVPAQQSAFISRGTANCIRVCAADGRELICTPDHRLLVTSLDEPVPYWKMAKDLISYFDRIVCGPLGAASTPQSGDDAWKLVAGDVTFDMTQNGGFLPMFIVVHSITDAGMHQVYDISVLEVESFLANGFVVHNCSLVSDGISSKIRKVLADRNPVGAFVELQQEVDDLNNQVVDPSMLVVSKSLSKEPEGYSPVPIHAKLALKMRAREPETAPHCGARVPYVVVQGNTKDKTSDLGEDPMFALKNGIPLNIAHYAESYRKPCKRLFDPILPGIVERIFDDRELPTERRQNGTLTAMFNKRKITDDEIARIDADLQKRQKLAASASGEKKKASTRLQSGRPESDKTLAWARKVSRVSIQDVEQRLRDDRVKRFGSARRRITTHASKTSPLARITRVLPQCMACQTPVHCEVCPRGSCDCEGMVRAVCSACCQSQPALVKTLEKRTQESYISWKQQHNELWSGCVKCAGSMEAALECANSTCRKFFVRDQARIEYERADLKLQRFSLVKVPM